MFCNESRFVLTRVDGWHSVHHRTVENQIQEVYDPNIAHGHGSVHVWAGIHHGSKMAFVQFNQHVHDTIYRQTLIRHFLPHTRWHLGASWELPHDNAPAHTTQSVINYLSNQGVQVMDWPAYPPNMDLIEHLWDQIASAMEAQHPTANLQQLGAAL